MTDHDPPIDTDDFAIDRLPWPAVRRGLARDPRLLLAVGSLEQHGPHLPLATGTLIAEHVVRELSTRLGLLHAPAFDYGVNLPGSHRFPGTAGLRRKTLHRAVNELFSSWEDHGVTEFVVVTASRSEPHIDALLMALTSDARTTVIDLFSLDLSRHRPGDPEPEHAGEVETSIMLHLRPDLVRTEAVHDAPPAERAVRRYVGGRPLTPPEASGGVIGHPSRASAERGAAILRSWLDDLVTLLDPSPTGPPAPTTV
ncbi:MAG: creatininase family protein [Gemmatimonadetes bacterium]|nr:creatininase family protein [Gemmatimonadota bacterium]